MIGASGTLPTEGARVIDAAGQIVSPGGVEPHAHLAHGIMSHPEQPAMTLGPEDDTKGMACGGTTTHIDFAYVRPGLDIQPVIEQRASRWKGNSYVDYAFHLTLAGALPIRVFDQIGEAVQAGYPELQGLHHQRAAAASEARGQPHRLRAHPLRDGEGREGGRHHGRARRGRGPGPVQLRALPRGGAHGGEQPPSRPHQALGAARLPADDRAGQGDRGRRVLRPRLRAGGRRVHRGGPVAGAARVRRDAAPVRVLQRRVLQDPARVLLAHLPVAQVPRGSEGALGRARARRALHPRDRRVPDEPRAQAQGPHHRGRDRAATWARRRGSASATPRG